jgi:hypothetical protein
MILLSGQSIRPIRWKSRNGGANASGTLSLWSRLQAENAPVRRIENGDLASASIDCWDSLILDQVLADWRRAALVVGHVLATRFDTGLYQFGDMLIFSRLRHLVRDKRIIGRGELHTSTFLVKRA